MLGAAPLAGKMANAHAVMNAIHEWWMTSGEDYLRLYRRASTTSAKAGEDCLRLG